MNVRMDGLFLSTGLKLFSCQAGKLPVLSQRRAARSGDEGRAAACSINLIIESPAVW